MEKRIKELDDSGKRDEAITLAKELLAFRIEQQGADHYEVTNARLLFEDLQRPPLTAEERKQWNEALRLRSEADAFYRKGQAAAAVPLMEKSLALIEAVRSKNHPDYAMSLNNLAYLYRSKGDYARAEPLYLEAGGLHKKLLGESHPDYAMSLNNLAYLYRSKGDYARAEPLYLEAHDLNKKLLGENHPDYAATLNNLAGLYMSKGDYARAEPLYLEARDLVKKLLGDNHPDYAARLNSLAYLYASKGDYARAEPLYLEARDLVKKLLGENDPRYSTSLNNLASLYASKGDYARAEPLYLEARDLHKKLLRENHPDYARSLNNLAYLYASKGDYARAEPLYLEARDLFKKLLGENHPEYAMSLNNLAGLYQSKWDHARAEPLFLEARDLYKKLLGENHPDYAMSLKNLAYLYMSKGDYARAEPILAACRLSFEMARLTRAKGLGRAVGGEGQNPYPPLAAVSARLGNVREAFAALNLNLARATADELARRQNLGLPFKQEQKRKEIAERQVPIDRRIVYLLTQPKLDDGERKELDALQAERQSLNLELSKIAASFSQSQVEDLQKVQDSLAADQALLAWVDATNSTGRTQEHWACVLRHAADPIWSPLPGTGKDGAWSREDDAVTARLRDALRGTTTTARDIDALVTQARTQRLVPVEKHLAGVNRLLVIATDQMAGLPIELLAPKFQVEYVQSGTALVWAASKPKPEGGSSLLAVGDPVLPPTVPGKERPLPPGGLLVQTVVEGGAAFQHLQSGDVLLSYGGTELSDVEALGKALATHAKDKTVLVKIWRVTETGEPVTRTLDLAPGRLGVTMAKGSAREVLAARHRAKSNSPSSPVAAGSTRRLVRSCRGRNCRARPSS